MTPPRSHFPTNLEARLRAEADEALRRLRRRLDTPLRTTVARLFRWLELEPARPERAQAPALAQDPLATSWPVADPPWAPTSFHDTRAEPILVRVTQGVVNRILGDAVDHVRGPRGEDETGWVPVGHVEQGTVVIEGLLPKGRGARATPGEFEIDHGHVLAALSLAQARRPTQVVGLVHTHPGRMDYNSTTDQTADELHVVTLSGGVGAYPVIVRELALVRGHVVRTGLRLAWWGMRASRPGVYVPCQVEVVPGPDVAAWVAEHADALAEAGDTLLELLERQLDAVLLPAPAGAVDLVANLGPSSVFVRFNPEPARIVLATASSRVPMGGTVTRGRRLGRRIAEALTQAQRATDTSSVGLHGAPEERPVSDAPRRSSKRTTPHMTRGDRSGRSGGSTSKKPRRSNRKV